MTWWLWVLVGTYGFGLVATLVLHLMFLQMVTPALALLRAVAWPIFWTTGRPRGTPLPMD